MCIVNRKQTYLLEYLIFLRHIRQSYDTEFLILIDHRAHVIIARCASEDISVEEEKSKLFQKLLKHVGFPMVLKQCS